MKASFFIKILLFFYLIFPLTLLAQETEEAQPVTGEAAAAAETRPENGGTITIDFKDADIRNVLRVISQKAGVNIIAAPEVQGQVTAKFEDVQWEVALDIILKTYGYGYERSDNILRVATLEKLKLEKDAEIALKESTKQKEEVKIEVIRLNHIDGENAKAVIAGGKYRIFQKVNHEGSGKGDVTYQEIELLGLNVISEAGTLQFEPTTNSLIIHDRVSVIKKVKELISEIDKPISQVLIEAKVIETGLTNYKDLGIKWNITGDIGLTQGAEIPTTFPFDKKEGTRGKFTPSIDPSKRGQGKDWPLASDLNPLVGPGHEELFPYLGSSSFTAADHFSFGTLSFTQLKILLEALETRSDTNILSNPNIVTVNHQQAMIDVVTEYPVPAWSFNEETGEMLASGIDYKEYGISLVVTPTVYPDRKIGLILVPIVKEISGTTTIQGASIPILDTKQVVTRVSIKSGDTVAIGGLMKDKKVKTVTKVPILGDIPLIGLLFRHNNTDMIKTNIIIFVTATVLESEELAALSKETMDKTKK